MKDKYKEYKPEAFEFQKNEDFTPGLFFGAILCVISGIISISTILLVILIIIGV